MYSNSGMNFICCSHSFGGYSGPSTHRPTSMASVQVSVQPRNLDTIARAKKETQPSNSSFKLTFSEVWRTGITLNVRVGKRITPSLHYNPLRFNDKESRTAGMEEFDFVSKCVTQKKVLQQIVPQSESQQLLVGRLRRLVRDAASRKRWRSPSERPLIMSNVACKSRACLCPPSSRRLPHPAGVKCTRVCVCVCKGPGFDSSTFGSSVDHGSAAQTWKCSDVSSQPGPLVRDLIPSDIFSH